MSNEIGNVKRVVKQLAVKVNVIVEKGAVISNALRHTLNSQLSH